MTHAPADHPSTHLGCDTFRFLMFRWCKTLAAELIAADPTAANLHPHGGIAMLDSFLPLCPPTPGFIDLISIPVDVEHAMTTDLSVPIVVAPIAPESGQDNGSIVIDGWHRIYRARREGHDTLPALLLTAETERTTRIPMPTYL